MDVDSDTKTPAPTATMPDTTHVGTVDGWIEMLMQCKQLNEADVQRLCDKVSLIRCDCTSLATYSRVTLRVCLVAPLQACYRSLRDPVVMITRSIYILACSNN